MLAGGRGGEASFQWLQEENGEDWFLYTPPQLLVREMGVEELPILPGTEMGAIGAFLHTCALAEGWRIDACMRNGARIT